MGLKSQILTTKNTQKFRAPAVLQLAAGDITLKLKFISENFDSASSWYTLRNAAGNFFRLLHEEKLCLFS